MAWSAAWTRPDVFRAVVGMSVPFGGRGLAALPGNPFGERRPSLVHHEIAGPGLLFYQDYFALPGGNRRQAQAAVRRRPDGQTASRARLARRMAPARSFDMQIRKQNRIGP